MRKFEEFENDQERAAFNQPIGSSRCFHSLPAVRMFIVVAIKNKHSLHRLGCRARWSSGCLMPNNDCYG